MNTGEKSCSPESCDMRKTQLRSGAGAVGDENALEFSAHCGLSAAKRNMPLPAEVCLPTPKRLPQWKMRIRSGVQHSMRMDPVQPLRWISWPVLPETRC